MGPPLPDNTLDQPLPSPLAPHLHTLVSFQHHCHSLCKQLFTHLASALQTPPDWFTSRHDQSKGPSGTVFRMLYYPANDAVDGTDLRAGAHSDFGSLTLLFQLPGQPGLEIKTPEGHWASVPVDPSNSNSAGPGAEHSKALPILVNIGDLLEDVRTLPIILQNNICKLTNKPQQSGQPVSSSRLSTASSSQRRKQNRKTATRSPTSATRLMTPYSSLYPVLSWASTRPMAKRVDAGRQVAEQ